MTDQESQCPQCQSPVVFAAAASVLCTCHICQGLISKDRTDGSLEFFGQSVTGPSRASVLQLGLNGKWKDVEFTILGCVDYSLGSNYRSEWYIVFEDGRWGWLVETQEQLFVLLAVEDERHALGAFPNWSDVRLRSSFRFAQHRLSVYQRFAEKLVSIVGELPFIPVLGAQRRTVLLKEDKLVGRYDYGFEDCETAIDGDFYLGVDVEYENLFERRLLRKPNNSHVSDCPSCGKPFSIHVPKTIRRIICEHCNAQIDATVAGELLLRQVLSLDLHKTDLIRLGASGWLDGSKWTVLGYVQREGLSGVDEIRWREYWLHAADHGHAVLTEYLGHWTLAKEISVFDVSSSDQKRNYAGQDLRLYEKLECINKRVAGGFPWSIQPGDVVSIERYVSSSSVLQEETHNGEVKLLLGTYVRAQDVQEAFGLTRLPKVVESVPYQENPYKANIPSLIQAGVFFSMLLFLSALFIYGSGEGGELVHQFITLKKNYELTQAVNKGFERRIEPFYLMTSKILVVKARVADNNKVPRPPQCDMKGGNCLSDIDGNDVCWVFLNGQLENLKLHETRSFGLYIRCDAASLHHREVYLGAIQPGEYALSINPRWRGFDHGGRSGIDLHIYFGSFFWVDRILTSLGLLWSIPIIQIVRYYLFEKHRFMQRMYGLKL